MGAKLMEVANRRHWIQAISSFFMVGLVTGTMAIGAAVVGVDPETALAQQAANAMALDADPSTAEVDPSVGRPLDVEFDIGASMTVAGKPYVGYNLYIQFDASRLSWVGVPPLGIMYVNSSSHGMTLEAMAALAANVVKGGAVTAEAPTSFVGPLALVRFKCIAPGPASLHLVSQTDSPRTFTTALTNDAQAVIDTALSDAQIICGEGSGPTPTTPPAGTPTPPAATPTVPLGPQPTPTPLPPGFEAVPVAAGCNPVTSTYPDATPIQTLSDAVGPAGNLVSLWEFDMGTWRAFSPQYPQASDLTEADLLDVVFACVSGPGDFVRPMI